MKCWSETVLDKLPPIDLVLVKNKDGSYHPAIVKSINEDGTITIIESNEEEYETQRSTKVCD